ncbi:MAG: PF20097 family protein [Sedimentibacter sp.]
MERKSETFSCPICGQVMEKGYVHSRKQILWSEDDKPRLFDFYDENLVAMPIRRANKVPGLRCKGCKIVLFEYE